MSQKMIRSYTWILTAIFGLIVVHAPLTVFFGSRFPDIALPIKAWKEILMVVAGLMAVWIVTKCRAWRQLANDRLVWMVVGFVVIHLCSLVQWNGLPSVVAGLMIDVRYVVFFGLMYIRTVMHPDSKSRMYRVAIVGAVIVLGFAALQLLLPPDFLTNIGYSKATIAPYTTVDQNHNFMRLQSTLRGPNPFGAYAAAVAVIIIAWIVSRKDHRAQKGLIYCALATSALCYLSYARSAYVALVVGGFIVLCAAWHRRVRTWQWVAIAAMIGIVGISLFAMRSNAFVSTVLLHEDPHESGLVNSNDGHLVSLADGFQRMSVQPFGAGIGSTGSASMLSDQPLVIENQYLYIAHEAGWLGLIVFMWLYGVILHRLWRTRSNPWALGMFASGIGMAVIGLVLPVWVDDTVSILWWGMAALTIGGSHVASTTNKKAATTT